MSRSETGTDLPGWATGIALIAGTVAVAGVTDYLLTSAGYGLFGTAVWVLCYVTAIAVVWIVWLRDIEFSGPKSG